MSFRGDGFWPAGDVSTNHRGCHAFVRAEESRCNIEVLCPVGDSEGAQLERDEQDAEADVDKKEKKHRCRCDGRLLGQPPRKKYELIVCHMFRFVTGVLKVSLEVPRTGRIESGTVRKP